MATTATSLFDDHVRVDVPQVLAWWQRQVSPPLL